jgi:AcrR family transcriptional regulator
VTDSVVPGPDAPRSGFAVRRPHRADARRNFDALLNAARDAFAEHGSGASLEDIARRAGVGIGTLYRNFPTRQDLFDSVYVGEVEQLCRAAEEVAELPPWEAFVTWLRRFVDEAQRERVLRIALDGVRAQA